MRPIIRWNLWSRRWSTRWWSVGIAAFAALELSVYSSVKSQAAQLNQALAHLPGSVKSLFGANTDLFSPVGYLNSRLFYLLLPLMLSILAIGLGSSLIAREETEGTIELIVGRPISRARFVLSKALSGLIVLAIVSILSAGAIMLLVKLVKLPVPLPYVAFATAMAAVLAGFFGAIAFFVSCLDARGRGASIAVASLVGLGSYIVASLEGDVHWLKWPARLLPYHYYNPTTILSGHYAWLTMCWYGAMVLVLGILSWLAFRYRDIGG